MGPLAALRRLRTGEAGQALVELGLAAPILVFALIGGLDLMRVGAIQNAIENAARIGAESAGSDVTLSTTALRAGISDALGGTPGLSSLSASDCTSPTPSTPCAILPAQPTGLYQGTWGDGTTACTSSVATHICYVTVEVRFTFSTLVPWPIVPNQVTVDRTAVFPMTN